MCGRYSLIADISGLQERFDFDGSELTHVPRYNIAPTQMALAVTNGGVRRGSYMRWGLVPSWAKSASVGSRMINARAEDGRREAQLPNCVTETTVPGSGRWLLRVAGERLQQEAHEDHDGIG
jgi:putative SOS response-associated peptidase YedK